MREMFRGDTLQFTATVKTETGAVYDLTGGKLWMTAKYYDEELDSEAVFKLTSDPSGGIEITSAVNGAIRVTIVPAKTQAMPDGVCDLSYDIVLRDVLGTVLTIEKDVLRVKPRPTRILT
jgi:hypothetical protein